MSRKTLTDHQISKLRPDPAKRLTIADPDLPGHYLRVTPNGAKSFICVARNPGGKQVWTTLGSASHISIGESRGRAKVAIGRVKQGLPAFETPGRTFDEVAADWLKRHVDAKGLRSAAEIRRVLARYVSPTLGALPFEGIRRADVVALLDHVEDEHGPGQADAVLAQVRSLMNWHAARSGDYTVPLVKGMGRNASTPRDRILDDDEIRAVWAAAPASLKIALLTGQRKAVVLGMRWGDVEGGVWKIATPERGKGRGGDLKLPALALAILAEQPRLASDDRVFRGFNSRQKRALIQRSDTEGWTIHDLRRTATSLMARAGVPDNVAERTIGHKIPGVRGIYNRHRYVEEKADALAKLASLLERIICPVDNVIAFRQ